MCDPVSFLMIAGTVVSGYGQMQQAAAAQQAAQAQAQAMQYNAQIAEMNAQISERRAKDALERGALEEQQQRLRAAQLQGKQRAALAANGVDLTFGSPLDEMVDTAVLGELDALTIRSNAAREAYDFEVQAANQRAGGQLNLMQRDSALAEGRAARTAGLIGFGSTVLGGLGDTMKYRASLA